MRSISLWRREEGLEGKGLEETEHLIGETVARPTSFRYVSRDNLVGSHFQRAAPNGD